MPSIMLLSGQQKPHGFFGCWGAYLKCYVPVPDELLTLPFQQELQAVFTLYKKRHEQILDESGDYLANGFSYKRRDNQTLVFDIDMRLIDVL